MSYISLSVGRIFFALVDYVIFADGYCDARSCTTTTCFQDGIGPNRSTGTDSEHLYGIYLMMFHWIQNFLACKYLVVATILNKVFNFFEHVMEKETKT